jgi:hypothetical protein
MSEPDFTSGDCGSGATTFLPARFPGCRGQTGRPVRTVAGKKYTATAQMKPSRLRGASIFRGESPASSGGLSRHEAINQGGQGREWAGEPNLRVRARLREGVSQMRLHGFCSWDRGPGRARTDSTAFHSSKAGGRGTGITSKGPAPERRAILTGPMFVSPMPSQASHTGL